MDSKSGAASVEYNAAVDASGIGGHPRGLTTLFFTEMWERLSYYGMRSILMLYMTKSLVEGGLGFDNAKAGSIYGTYTASVYLTPLLGGWLADRFLGARLAVLIGGIIIAMGHFSMALPSLPSFYAGLFLVAFGTGLLKPNISTMVGSLYSEDDPRRDSGFSIFYMGINLGAFLAPFVCGTLAQDERFKSFLASMGFDPKNSWHWGFGAAGVGMVLGLIQYIAHRRRLAHVGGRPQRREIAPAPAASSGAINPGSRAAAAAGLISRLLWALALIFAAALILGLAMYFLGGPAGIKPTSALLWVFLSFICVLLSNVAGYFKEVLSAGESARAAEEFKRILVIGVLFLFSAIFWMAFEQAGSSLTLFADKLTRNSIFGYEFPSSWFQSVNPVLIVLFAPVFSWLWLKLGERQPSSPAKFSIGLFFAGLGFVVVAFAASLTGSGKVSPLWLIVVYFFHTVGELCLSPVGLSIVTKLAPQKLVGQMMGVWFLSISLGNYFAGWVAGFFRAESEAALVGLFGKVAAVALAASLALAALTPYIKRLMGKVH